MSIGNVGEAKPGEKLAVPLGSLRKRCRFTPMFTETCHEASLGLAYDTLHHLYSQRFLCTSKVEGDNPRQACYFILSFGPPRRIPGSNVVDVHGIFDAPIMLSNKTGLPLDVALHYRLLKPSNDQRTSFLHQVFSDNYYYSHVATLSVESEQSYPVTQVDPTTDLYMTILLTQPNGESLGQIGTKAKGKQQFVLVRSRSLEEREQTVTLLDANGEELVLILRYSGRTISVHCPYWIVNQSTHYLQVAAAGSKTRAGLLCAGMAEGIAPGNSSPFLVSTMRYVKDPERAHIFLRVGRHSPEGNILWSEWSGAVPIFAIGDMSIVHCGDEAECVTISYSVAFVGGGLEDTRVIKIAPRWIVMNRCPYPLCIQQHKQLPSAVLPPESSHVIDTRLNGVTNVVQVRHAGGQERHGTVTSCTWSAPINIDKLGDHAVNIRFTTRRSPTGAERNDSYVSHVTIYSKGSIYFICIEKTDRPPHIIENRTGYVVHVRQRSAEDQLAVYPRTTSGFVWDDLNAPPVLQLWASEGHAQARPITINLNPAMLVTRSWNQMQSELTLPGGVVLYVRIRSLKSSFAISVTADTAIDRTLHRPFRQFRYQLLLDSVNLLIADSGPDIALFTAGLDGGISLVLAQDRGTGEREDEFSAEASFGLIQLSDERENSKQRVVMQTLDRRQSTFKLCRRMQRSTPMILISFVEVVQQPISIHLEDGFLFEFIRLFERFSTALGRTTTRGNLSSFDHISWHVELTKPIASQDNLQNRMTFVEHLLISQLSVSVSLYRGNSDDDPIREKLGFLSILVRSVNDARFDWRRIDYDNIYDRMWLLATFMANFYSAELQRQMLNVIHVAGLDVMRGFVTDLLEGYFASSAPVHIDRSATLTSRRSQIPFQESTNERPTIEIPMRVNRDFNDDVGQWDDSNADPSIRWKTLYRNRLIGRTKIVLPMEEYATTTPWEEFCKNVSTVELRNYGHLALRQLLRSRNFEEPGRSSVCQRCAEIEALRQERVDAGITPPLPHPEKTGGITMFEYAHHCTWAEFTTTFPPREIQQYRDLVKNGIVGVSYNVRRVDAATERILRQSKTSENEEEGDNNNKGDNEDDDSGSVPASMREEVER